ncbi:hypothetical protein ACLKA6_014249 [Drosophila palustris]
MGEVQQQQQQEMQEQQQQQQQQQQITEADQDSKLLLTNPSEDEKVSLNNKAQSVAFYPSKSFNEKGCKFAVVAAVSDNVASAGQAPHG